MSRARLALVLLSVSAVWCFLVVVIHRDSPRTLVSAHGLLHAAISDEIRAAPDGPLPPQNPFYAGRPLRYYWTFQWLGAQLSRLSGLHPLLCFEAMIVASLAVLVIAAGLLGARLYGCIASAFTLGFLILAGCNPQGPLILVARYLRHGAALFEEDGRYLWGIVHPANQQMRLLDPWSMYGPLAQFFLNITARPLALASLVLVLLCLQRAWMRRQGTALVGLAITSALLTGFSPVVGLGIAATLGVALAVVGRGRTATPWPLLIAALWLGVLLAFPTYYHILGYGSVQMKNPGQVVRFLGALLIASWLLVLLAVIGWRSLAGHERHFAAAALLAAGIVIGVSSLLSLPVGNEDNWYHAGLILLAVPAAAVVRRSGVPRWFPGARLRQIGVVAAFLPALTIQLSSYVGRPAVALEVRGDRLWSKDPQSARLYAWAREETAPDAVFVLDPGEFRASVGNTMEWPALTGRRLFTEHQRHYLCAGEPDCAQRVAIAEALTSGTPIAVEDAVLLYGVDAKVYIVTRCSDPASRREDLIERYGPPAFEDGSVLAFSFRADP